MHVSPSHLVLRQISANLPDMSMKGNPSFTRNRLAEATSPYLLQHKDNPVHWQPWEAAVFEEARRRNVPVLLSIGYAACHWCHVMAHESFEDAEVAALMNAHFVCIKLDREERPDLDEIYMSALSMMGEQGGWPLTICLDATGAPFWGGTYFPKTPQYGRPGFIQILTEISRVWRETPDKIAANTKALTQSLKAKAQADARGDMPDDLIDKAAKSLSDYIDLDKGGLAGAPKFPQPFLYRFLWQQAQLTGDAAMRDGVLITLRKICQGGIYDHIGGGFARYSVDADWLVPHFEKMLYDNALLIELLCTVYRDTGEPLFAARIEESISWLAREMLTDEGAFAASLDADTEGEEGKFYVWDKAEIETLLGDEAALSSDEIERFCTAYDITAGGNFEGKNNPNLLAAGDAPKPEFEGARNLLFRAREKRIAPGRDDKILADWNAMMIKALAEAAVLFDRDDWLTLAKTAYKAVRHTLTDKDGTLCHAARAGRQLSISLAGDYGFIGQAAAALYQATGEAAYLIEAQDYGAALHEKFHDKKQGGYLTNQADAQNLLVNNRAVQDNAQPSANAAALELFSTLSVLTAKRDWHEKAEAGFAALSGMVTKNYPSMTAFLSARLAHDTPLSIVIIGDGEAARILYRAAATHKINLRHIIALSPQANLPPEHPAALALADKTTQNGQATAYICPGQSCLAPVTTPEALRQSLDAMLAQRQTKA